MSDLKKPSRKGTSLTASIAYFYLLFSAVNAFGDPPQVKPPAQHAPKILANSDLLGLLDCAPPADQLLAVRPEFYVSDGFRARYLYPVRPGRDANLLNMMRPTNWVSLVLYQRDLRYSVLFEVGFDGPPSKRTFVLLDGANLEIRGARWAVKDLLSGGASTWPEIVDHIDRISEAPLVTMRRADVTRTNAACEVPTPGLTFSAVCVSGDP